MSSRFTETEKWNDVWFRKLSVEAKLLFLYLVDNCDCAGFWEIDLENASFQTGIPLKDNQGLKELQPEMDIHKALDSLKKAYISDEKYLWIKNFIYYQGNFPLNPEMRQHIGIIKRLHSHNALSEKALKILEEIALNKGINTSYMGLSKAYGIGKGIGKGISNNKGDYKGEDFEAFWKSYPRKTGKGAARKIWIRIKPSKELLGKMLEAIEKQKQSEEWQKDGGQFIPYPSKWLNQERWLDEIIIHKADNENGDFIKRMQERKELREKMTGKKQ